MGKRVQSGPKYLAPGWSAFADGQMSWGDVAFDADFPTGVGGDLLGAPALYPRDVECGKSAGHSGHDRSRQQQRLGRRNRHRLRLHCPMPLPGVARAITSALYPSGNATIME